jgi:uncharacterized NAD-dependent epimerase/dehydratase family protein
MAMVNETALVYCENQFGLVDGKTASGLVRHSDAYTIVGVIDSSLAGKDAGEELGKEKRGIPIFADLEDALSKLSTVPDCYIYGKAPLETQISAKERRLILEAMENGMDIINGLHQFFSDDPEFVHMAARSHVRIKDIRKPPKLKDLHVFSGQRSKVTIPVVAVLGTDCACGKRTTTVELNNSLNRIGIKSIMVATGQSGLMQGALYGVAIDALISQFVIGEIENAVIQAFDNESPDIILVEGQSAVSHPAFMGSLGILKGSEPDGVILQHPPARKYRCDFPNLKMPVVESEIDLIEAISQTKVMAIALLRHGCGKLVRTLCKHFPKFRQKIKRKHDEKTRALAA